MRIGYKDIQRGSDYHGTKIIIDLSESDIDEKLRVHCLLLSLVKPRGWHYKCEVTENTVTYFGYDGFNASLIEGEITGEFKSYLGDRNQVLKPRDSIYEGFMSAERRIAANVTP